MKNSKKLVFIGLVALIAIFGITACGDDDDDDDDDNKTPTTYTVTFNSNGGSAVSKITGLEKGATIEKPTDPTKEGIENIITSFTFAGWYKEAEFANAWNFASDTVTGNITLYAKWSVTFRYALGDTGPGGGKIFYRSETGFTMTDDNSTAHYLEAAPNNMATTLNWCLFEYYNTYIADTATEIGSGRKNTALILATDQNAYAALACKNYTYNGKSDWFLPSKDELNELYKSKDSVGNLGTSSYWSSSQYNTYRVAWSQSFNTGSQNTSDKSSAIQVRAVRAF